MSKVAIAGLDLGTNTTVLVCSDETPEFDSQKIKSAQASKAEVANAPVREWVFNTVVGIPKPNILPGILPNGKKPVFGNEAITYKAHVDLHWPVSGTVTDRDHARMFMEAVKESLVGQDEKTEVRMVIGSPANASAEELADIRAAVSGIIDKIVIVPEPFLAAMGFRDENKLGQSDYHDPVVNTLFVDIGAGTTDLCKIQGYYPTKDDLISMPIGGNSIDLHLKRLILKKYPDAKFADVTINKIKDENSFVYDHRKKVEVSVPVQGKHRTLDLTDAIRESCESIVDPIVEAIEEMARRCDPENVEEMLGNIILTGGGSQIKGLAQSLEAFLHKKDYLSAKVHLAGEYKPLVARGAMKTGLKLKDDQWSIPM